MDERDLTVTEEELHAYVDGELPQDRLAAVEAWLAAHPEDASRVGAWRAQADAIRARYGATASETVPARFDLETLARGERRWIRMAVAAAVLALMIGCAGGWFARAAFEGVPSARAVTAEAVDAHRLYVVEVRHPVEVPGAEKDHLGQWLSRRVGHSIAAPDLDGLGLKLVGGRLLPSVTGAGAAFFMYEGASGERFTIYCRKTTAPDTALRYRDAGPVASFFWIDDDLGYVVSGPADRARLQKVAEAAYQHFEGRARTGQRGRMAER